ncbi:MAG: bifunctional adenosylcobinamide kinase/adenosylcobinamide-phosphate guanylyltransferase [Methylophilales bacterium]|nr:bifunctional adenosylcobinamide kinase/adenosylcobinamide-phosphate guanylyltransferase [Methylophilales bacterium]
MGLSLILGGARSGKSSHAERLAIETDLPVTYIATAQVADKEFAERIRSHQLRRPLHWTLVEESFFLAETLLKNASVNHCLVVDCLTLWLAQWICEDCKPPQDKSWESERQTFLSVLPTLPGEIILVSNEVGMGIVPLGEINRRFQDEQGRLNQAVAALSGRVVFMAAGLVMSLKG